MLIPSLNALNKKVLNLSLQCVLKISRLRNNAIFFINLEPTSNFNEIRYIKDINQLYIKVEAYHGSRVKQCYRYRQFWHSSTTYLLKSKCFRCDEDHILSKSDNKGTPPKCANCGGAHTANYCGCNKNPCKRKNDAKPLPPVLIKT